MVLPKSTADKKLRRMALEIACDHNDKTELFIIGIKENGFFIATKLAEYLKSSFTGNISVIALKIDKRSPGAIELSEKTNLEGKTIVLVDDVANSGRTMLYALKPLLDMYPAQIATLALVERMYKRFPAALNYVGLSIATAPNEHIEVKVSDEGITAAIRPQVLSR